MNDRLDDDKSMFSREAPEGEGEGELEIEEGEVEVIE